MRLRNPVLMPFAAIVLAMLPAVLDQTILATALPTIATDLGRLSDVAWVVTAYVIAAAAATPLWGKLGDRQGRKPMLQGALVMFIASSALCGAASDITMLIVLRAVQGLAAGGLMALAMAAVGDLVSMRERGRYQGYIALVFAVATVVGPLLGGVLVQHASWRWVFYVNVPVGLAALVGLNRTLPAAELDRPRARLDLTGAALVAGAAIALMLACVWGGEHYAWDSAQIVGLFAGALALGTLFVVRERSAADPLVPLAMLRSRVVATASIALFLATASLFAVTVFVPLFLQATTGASPTRSGLLLAPMMAGITVSTMLAGRSMTRTGRYKRFPVAGLAIMTASLAVLGAVAAQPSRTTIAIAIGGFGLGFGMVSQVLVVAVQNGVEQRQIGVATAATTFFRGLGGAVGAAALGAVFAARAAGVHGSQIGAQALGHGGRAAVIDGVQAVFLTAAPLALVAMLVVLRLPEAPLRTQVGAQRPKSDAPRKAVTA